MRAAHFWLRTLLLRRAPRLFARVCVPDRRELGELGEEVAVQALLRAGFVIEGRRVRTSFAEIDVLARDGSELVLVEVKTARVEPVPGPRGARRDPPRFRADGRLGSLQALRLERAAAALARHRRTCARVDVVDVVVCARSRHVRVEHRMRKTFPVDRAR